MIHIGLDSPLKCHEEQLETFQEICPPSLSFFNNPQWRGVQFPRVGCVETGKSVEPIVTVHPNNADIKLSVQHSFTEKISYRRELLCKIRVSSAVEP